MIDHVFNDEGFQIVENLLNLASDIILQETADTLADLIHKCWLYPNKVDNLQLILMDAYSLGLYHFINGLSDAQIQAAYGRSDITAEETLHKLYTHMRITLQPRSDIVCSVEMTSCDAYVWLVILSKGSYLGSRLT